MSKVKTSPRQVPIVHAHLVPHSASPSPHWLPVLWMSLSTLIVFWDAGFCLMRPRSMAGGDLQWIWKPYEIYEKVDLVYGPASFKSGDPFTSSQAILNLAENAMNIVYLVLARQPNPIAPLIGLIAVVCTFWKTVLYWMMDQQCGWCRTGHNSPKDWWLLFAFPNGFWLVVPAILVLMFGDEIATALRTTAQGRTTKRTL